MMALAGLWSLFNLVVLVLLVVLAIFGIQALRKYLKTPEGPARSPLAANLGQRRLARGMAPEAVAQALGVSPQTVTAWEGGPWSPTTASWPPWQGCTAAPLPSCSSRAPDAFSHSKPPPASPPGVVFCL